MSELPINVKELVRVTDVQEAIEAFKAESGDFVGVVMLGISKEHGPMLRSSTLENYQFAYLGAFFQARVNAMFNKVEKM